MYYQLTKFDHAGVSIATLQILSPLVLFDVNPIHQMALICNPIVLLKNVGHQFSKFKFYYFLFASLCVKELILQIIQRKFLFIAVIFDVICTLKLRPFTDIFKSNLFEMRIFWLRAQRSSINSIVEVIDRFVFEEANH